MRNIAQNGYSVAVAVIVVGVLLAVAVLFIGNRGSENLRDSRSSRASARTPLEFRLPNETDHVRGDENATISIVEYSDFNCAFCARLHPTLSRIVEEYDGEVKWVYRHFANYAKGEVAAIGSECATKLGGNHAFWGFSDRMFDNQRRLGDKFSIETAVALGIDQTEFVACLDNSREVEKRIATDYNESISLGGRGTPYVVVVTPKSQLMPFSGALPYE